MDCIVRKVAFFRHHSALNILVGQLDTPGTARVPYQLEHDKTTVTATFIAAVLRWLRAPLARLTTGFVCGAT